MNTKLQIAVLMGGPSEEREVSLRSGKAVMAALQRQGHAVHAVDPCEGKLSLPTQVDVAFLALHGTYGEDGQVQSELHRLGVAYTGSGPDASRLAFDKASAKKVFMERGLPTPAFSVISDADQLIPEELSLPLVVKPSCQGSSVGLHFVEKEAQWQPAIEQVLSMGGTALVEQCIQGRELTVAILDGRAHPIVEILPKDDAAYDYDHKYTLGATEYVCPAQLDTFQTERCQHIARQAYEALGCAGYGRVDLLLDCHGPTLLEVNTLPGMTETSLMPMAAQASGIDFDALCQWMVEDARKRHSAHPLSVNPSQSAPLS